MKTLFRIFALALLTSAMLSLSGCTNQRDHDRDRENSTISEESFREERNELRQDLRELRNDIDRELKKIDNRIDRAVGDNNPDRPGLEEANRKLTAERTRVDRALDDLENASAATWKDVKVAARKTSDDVGTAFRQMGNELEALFDDKDNDQ